MSAVISRGSGPSNAFAAPRLRTVMVLALGLAAPGTWAFENETSPMALASAAGAPEERERLRLELSTTSLPRFDNIDGSSHASRIDMTWLPPRRSALGLSLGMTSSHGPAFFRAGPQPATPPSVDLGLHWRYTQDASYRIDVTAWRRVVPADALTLVQTHEPSYGARVEMQIRPVPKTGFIADRGFIGFQLESGARVTLRRSGGKPMIYYRTKF